MPGLQLQVAQQTPIKLASMLQLSPSQSSTSGGGSSPSSFTSTTPPVVDKPVASWLEGVDTTKALVGLGIGVLMVGSLALVYTKRN